MAALGPCRGLEQLLQFKNIPRIVSRQMFQLPFQLAPSSDLPVATALPALPWIPPPRKGLQAVQVG